MFNFEITDTGIDMLTWRNFFNAIIISSSVVAFPAFMLAMLSFVMGWNVRVHLATSMLFNSLEVGMGESGVGDTSRGSGVFGGSLASLVGSMG